MRYRLKCTTRIWTGVKISRRRIHTRRTQRQDDFRKPLFPLLQRFVAIISSNVDCGGLMNPVLARGRDLVYNAFEVSCDRFVETGFFL